jgi:hypothetical protein
MGELKKGSRSNDFLPNSDEADAPNIEEKLCVKKSLDSWDNVLNTKSIIEFNYYLCCKNPT